MKKNTAVIWHFRYKKDKDGYYRLLAVRYESMDMKEQSISGLITTCTSQACSSELTFPAAAAAYDSLVIDPKESTAGDTAVPMSNLELLGNVAFAMSQPDGTDEYADTAGFALADGNHIIYIVPHGDDGTPQSFSTVLQPTVEPISAADDEDVVENYERCMADITNTSCLYYGTIPDSCNMPCSAGPRPVQYSGCDGVISTNEHFHDNMAGSCMEDEMAGFESDAASSNVVSTSNGGCIQSVDTSLEPFSLSMMTNAVTS